MSGRGKLPNKDNYFLWVKAGGRCEFKGCNKKLYEDSLIKSYVYNFADKAHIVCNSKKGPRGSKTLSAKLAVDIKNLMLLCKECHARIDSNIKLFPVKKLKDMKKEHESRIERVTSIIESNRTNIVLYSANISQQSNPININNAELAVIANNMYPVENIIDLSLYGHASMDDHEKFWHTEVDNLENRFEVKLRDLIADKNTNPHFSVFALAPIPLLIKLGTLLTDKTSVQVFQKSREPDSWNWQENSSELNLSILSAKNKFKKIALVLSISANIADKDVINVLGEHISIWKIEIKNPNNDCIRNKNQLSEFRVIYRKMLNEIKAVHGANVEINLFPAIPVSVAVEMGRVWMPKADLPIIIYDRNRGKGLPFIKRLIIGDNNG